MTVKITIAALRAAHPNFFERKTCRLFGDVSYRILTHRDGTKYLVRYTAQWSDMFGSPKRYRYRLNPIGVAPDYKILPLIDQEFSNLDEVKDWLRNGNTVGRMEVEA